MAKFDADTLAAFRDLEEIAIRTEKHPDTAVLVWVAVAGDEVFVRSARGTRGRWYRDVVAGGGAAVEFAGRRLPIEAIPAVDPASVDRASHGYRLKYPANPYLQSVLKPDILTTTLRLEPR